MRELLLAQLAKDDLAEIWDYIAADNPEAAMRLMEAFKAKFELLLTHPLIGKPRDELLLGLRSFAVGKYLIFYQSSDDFVEILRVRHGATNIQSLFEI